MMFEQIVATITLNRREGNISETIPGNFQYFQRSSSLNETERLCSELRVVSYNSKPPNAIRQTLSHTRKLFVLQVCDFIILFRIDVVGNQWV